MLTQANFRQWIQRIFATTNNEIDCAQFQLFLPAYVESKHTDAHLQNHLFQCPDCRELHDELAYVLQHLNQDSYLEAQSQTYQRNGQLKTATKKPDHAPTPPRSS